MVVWCAFVMSPVIQVAPMFKCVCVSVLLFFVLTLNSVTPNCKFYCINEILLRTRDMQERWELITARAATKVITKHKRY